VSDIVTLKSVQCHPGTEHH